MRSTSLILVILLASLIAHLLASSLLLAGTDEIQLQDDELIKRVQAFIDRILRIIEEVASYTLRGLLELLISLARIAYIVMAIAGLIMWATGFSIYSGRKFLIGALVLALIVELMKGFL